MSPAVGGLRLELDGKVGEAGVEDTQEPLQGVPADVEPAMLDVRDVSDTLRLAVNASDNDGQTLASSAPTSVVLASQGSLGALPGPGTSGAGTGLLIVGVGAPNGTTASETAQLRLGVHLGCEPVND
jgi:hypothetical protein